MHSGAWHPTARATDSRIAIAPNRVRRPGSQSASGTFGPRIDIGVSQFAVDLKLADLDGDGDLDIVGGGGGAVSTFMGNGDGRFGSRTDFAMDGEITQADINQSLALGDIDADTDLDLVVANSAFTSVNFDLVSVRLNRRILTPAPSPEPGDASTANLLAAEVPAAPAPARPGLGSLIARHVDQVLAAHAEPARLHLPAARRLPADAARRSNETHDSPAARSSLWASRHRRLIANHSADAIFAPDPVTNRHDG